MQQPVWLGEAWLEFGQREVAGNSDNPRIMALFRDAGAPGVAHDETAWCAAFVGACLKRSRIAATESLMARSYLDWGEAVVVDAGAVPLGAVAVMRRGSDPAQGHVGFLVGETEDGIILLGGNQSDCVSVAAFDRADLLALRWPAGMGSTASIAPSQPDRSNDRSPSDEPFETALAHVLEMEGGWTDDPADPGGPTNLGLTLADLAVWHGVHLDAMTRPALLDELRRLDVVAVRPIYHQHYWIASRADALPAGLALMHFDCAVNQGTGRAACFLQQAVGSLADGEIGPMTLAAASAADVGDTLERYADLRRAHYRGLATFSRFGRGWLARVDTTLSRALALAAAHASPVSQPVSRGQTPMTTTETSPVSPMPVPNMPAPAAGEPGTKWWGQSMTVWGALITAAATVVPALGPLIGVDLSAETIRQVGGQAGESVRALAGLVGTIMAIYGRSRASQPLMRRDFSLRL